MQIKHNSLSQHLSKKLFALYWFAGQETYLSEHSFKQTKDYLKKNQDCDETMLSIQAPDDWLLLSEEANNYSLFSERTLINIFYDKKSLDSTGKKIILEYLKNPNPRCSILIRTPNVPIKQLQWITATPEVLFVVHYPLNTQAMCQWIAEQFRNKHLTYEAGVPQLIEQYTQGNLLACAQAVEKISLNYSANSFITSEQALEHVFNQCEHTLYELTDSCLLGQKDKCIQILRHAANNKTEVILVLWMLTQEIRLLIQLHFLMHTTHLELKPACSQLKIWPQRVGLYQSAIKRLNPELLHYLLQECLHSDEQIKSNSNGSIWHNMERIALGLCHEQGRKLCTP